MRPLRSMKTILRINLRELAPHLAALQVLACASSGEVQGAVTGSSGGEGGATVGQAVGGMISIPPSSFVMGCIEAESGCSADERPSHMVQLAAFAIDVIEVTVAAFAECRGAGACFGDLSPAEEGTPAFDVSWMDAKRYCDYRGKRLPTEAEWELAARGVEERIFPWGAGAISCDLANYLDCKNDAGRAAVRKCGSQPGGATPAGLMDMAGNLGEWVADRYDANYYSDSPTQNPLGPAEDAGALDVVVRGGSFAQPANDLRTSARGHQSESSALHYVGFRCAKSMP